MSNLKLIGLSALYGALAGLVLVILVVTLTMLVRIAWGAEREVGYDHTNLWCVYFHEEVVPELFARGGPEDETYLRQHDEAELALCG